MNRTANCLRMLEVLKARGRMKKTDLAAVLETNVRNIREYKRELETAGYRFREVHGRNGGLELVTGTFLPTLNLSREELQALQEGRSLLHTHAEFAPVQTFDAAVDKVLNTSMAVEVPGIHYVNGLLPRSRKETELMDILRNASLVHEKVKITYRKRGASQAQTFVIHPYDLVHADGAYYVIAWSELRHDWRVYRISEMRMLSAVAMGTYFVRDSLYDLNDLVGRHFLVKGRNRTYMVEVQKSGEHLFRETAWGQDLTRVRETADTAVYSFVRQEEVQLLDLLFRLDGVVRLLEPESAKKAYEEKLARVAAAQKGVAV